MIPAESRPSPGQACGSRCVNRWLLALAGRECRRSMGVSNKAKPRQAADRAAALHAAAARAAARACRTARSPARRRRVAALGASSASPSCWPFSVPLGLAAVFGYIWFTLNQQGLLKIPERDPGIMILASDGSVLAEQGSFNGDEVRLAELPDYVPNAVIAIEDRRFHSHFGVDPIGLAARGLCQLQLGPRGAGRLHPHPAARQEPVPQPGPHDRAQAAGSGARRLARIALHQGGDPPALSEPRLFRRRRHRHREGGADLLPEARLRTQPRGSRNAGGRAQGAERHQSRLQPQGRRRARQARAPEHGGCRLHHAGRRPPRPPASRPRRRPPAYRLGQALCGRLGQRAASGIREGL